MSQHTDLAGSKMDNQVSELTQAHTFIHHKHIESLDKFGQILITKNVIE
ncbi:hypothetical protein GCS56_002269 [Vibrio metschnikovii]|nr:hypothetical protein [Vibrio metschnikovii]